MRTLGRSTLAKPSLFAALVVLAWLDTSSAVSAAPAGRCAACKVAAARRFLQARNVMDCRNGIPASDEARLRHAMRRCERRRDCFASGGADAIIAVLRGAVDAVEAQVCRVCRLPEGCGGHGGDPVDPSGPVGVVPPAVDPTAAPSFDDVAAFCRAHPDHDVPPPLLALPATTELPNWCSEDQAYRQMVEACGAPRLVVVAKGADPGAADGGFARPFVTITDAISACESESCHILVGPGTYVESLEVTQCTFIEGGIQIEGGVATRGAPRPRIEGAVSARGSSIVLARIDVQDDYGALSTDGDVLVSEAVLRGGYEGGSSAWGATGPRLCRTHIAAGYGGFDIAWHSSRLWLAGSAVSACYEGMALSWGSRGLKVVDSVVYGGYSAVGTSWGSVNVDVRGSRLGSAYAAVDIHIAPDEDDIFPATFDVSVRGNSIASGTLPESNPALNIIVENNVRE